MKRKSLKASEVFKVGENNIGYVWDSFIKEFGNDKVEKGSVLTSQKLTRTMTDSEILSELKVEECTLGDILETIKNATEDMKDGYYNIFYVKGHSRVVLVGWFGSLWFVGDWERLDDSWRGGRRVFSPATGPKALRSSPSEILTLFALEARIKELEVWKAKVQE